LVGIFDEGGGGSILARNLAYSTGFMDIDDEDCCGS
jgi:hypothetical protein